MQDRIAVADGDDNPPTRLSRAHELLLANAAGRLYGALYPAMDDLPQWVRSVLTETLADLDEVRGIDTHVVTARARAAEGSDCRGSYDPNRTPGGGESS